MSELLLTILKLTGALSAMGVAVFSAYILFSQDVAKVSGVWDICIKFENDSEWQKWKAFINQDKHEKEHYISGNIENISNPKARGPYNLKGIVVNNKIVMALRVERGSFFKGIISGREITGTYNSWGSTATWKAKKYSSSQLPCK